MEYKLGSWKYVVSGEFDSEESAIKELSDKYMTASKMDPPGEHGTELLSGVKYRKEEDCAKGVFLQVKEKIYGRMQWVTKYNLNIYPFKQKHWWDMINGDKYDFQECEFKYEIVNETEDI